MLKSFKTFLLEKQGGMLDISIPSFFKLLKIDVGKLVPGSKAYQNANVKIKEALSTPVRIEEKVDGVKLSIIRNGTDFDPLDYTKNWIVAYKTFILYPFEHNELESEEVKHPSNYGNSQYKLIHERLKKAHSSLDTIPKNTEFFLEFLMRKPTLTRSYGEEGIHSVLFLASSPTGTITIKNGKVTTESQEFNQFKPFIKTFTETTGFSPPKVVFSGTLFTNVDSSPEFDTAGFLYDKLKAKAISLKEELENALGDSDWVKVAKHLQVLFTTFESFYGGGTPEGVVCWPKNSSLPFKFTAAEQYDKELRQSIKDELVGSGKDLENYFDAIEDKAEELLTQIDTTRPFEDQVKAAAKLVYSQGLVDIDHPKKTKLNKQDDLFLKIKSFLMDLDDETSSSVVNRHLGPAEGLGLIVGKFRLPTIAHMELIRTALTSTNKVLLALVDTSKKGLTFNERKAILEQSFPGKLIITKVESANLSRLLKSFKGKISKIFCGTDALPAYQKQIDEFNSQYNTNITVHELERSEDDDVSATQVEKAIKSNDSDTFDRLASPLLKPYWDHLVTVIR